MQKKIAFAISVSSLFFAWLLFPFSVLAYDILKPGCVETPTDLTGGSRLDPAGKTIADVPSLACSAQIVANVVNIALVFLGLVTILSFLFGVLRFITSQGDTKGLQESHKIMTFSLIGCGAVITVFIIVNIITTTLGLPNFLLEFTFFQP